MLTSIYLFNVIAIGYLVYALERRYGTCMIYLGILGPDLLPPKLYFAF